MKSITYTTPPNKSNYLLAKLKTTSKNGTDDMGRPVGKHRTMFAFPNLTILNACVHADNNYCLYAAGCGSASFQPAWRPIFAIHEWERTLDQPWRIAFLVNVYQVTFQTDARIKPSVA